MDDTEHLAISQLGAGDAAGGLAAVDGSALEPERGRLAVLPQQGHRVRRARPQRTIWSRPRRCCPIPRATPGSAWCWSPRAGGGAGSRRGWSIPASTPRPSSASPPGSTRRPRAPRSMVRSASRRRIQLRRLRLANMHPARRCAAIRRQDRRIHRPATSARWALIAASLLQELGGRADSRLVSSGDAMALVRDGRTARHIGPLFATTPAHALALVRRHRRRAKRGPLLIDAVADADRISRRPDGQRLDHRAAVPAHALRPRHHARRTSCRSPSPAPNLDRTRHASQRDQIRDAAPDRRWHRAARASAGARRRPQARQACISAR